MLFGNGMTHVGTASALLELPREIDRSYQTIGDTAV
jgi:hypothetical protein